MAGFVEFALFFGCGSLLVLLSQMSEVLHLVWEVAVVRVGVDWARIWRREADRQRRDQRWREMWRESDAEDYDNYADFLGEFEEMTWWVDELFEDYCAGWYIVDAEFGNIEIDENEDLENWDI